MISKHKSLQHDSLRCNWLNDFTVLFRVACTSSALFLTLGYAEIPEDNRPTDPIAVAGAAHLDNKSESGATLVLKDESGEAVITFDLRDEPLDLSNYIHLSVRIDNQSNASVDLFVTGKGNPQSPWPGRLRGRFWLRPGEEDAVLNVLMTRPDLPNHHPLVQTFGNLYGMPGGHHRHWEYVADDQFIRVLVELHWQGAQPSQQLHISHPFGTGAYTADAAMLDDLNFPVVDRFGQLRWQEWEGKITSKDDFQRDAEADLERAEAITDFGPQRSRFGGYAGADPLESTGFFRVEQIDGQWWFVDPDGYLFWSIGANSVADASSTQVTGREILFPDDLRGQVNFHRKNLIHKYGESDWESKLIDVTVGRMMEWGLNTVGAWSKAEMFETERVPFTIQLHPFTTWIAPLSGMVDPFDPRFRESLEQRLADLAHTHAENPWLVGIFIHNELPWKNGIALGEAIINSPERLFARKAALAYLSNKYTSITDLNSAWDTDFKNFKTIQTPNEPTSAYESDITSIMEQFATEYFRISRDLMRTYFPNHLYLGCRFHTRNPIITRVASRYLDVISVNVYEYDLSGFQLEVDVSRPLLISEFHFGIPDFGHWGRGLRMAADARNQADLMRLYFHESLRHPDIVGAHWFAWADQPITGRSDGENFGIGLVSIVDRPHRLLVQSLRDVADNAYRIRRGE